MVVGTMAAEDMGDEASTAAGRVGVRRPGTGPAIPLMPPGPMVVWAP